MVNAHPQQNNDPRLQNPNIDLAHENFTVKKGAAFTLAAALSLFAGESTSYARLQDSKTEPAPHINIDKPAPQVQKTTSAEECKRQYQLAQLRYEIASAKNSTSTLSGINETDIFQYTSQEDFPPSLEGINQLQNLHDIIKANDEQKLRDGLGRNERKAEIAQREEALSKLDKNSFDYALAEVNLWREKWVQAAQDEMSFDQLKKALLDGYGGSLESLQEVITLAHGAFDDKGNVSVEGFKKWLAKVYSVRGAEAEKKLKVAEQATQSPNWGGEYEKLHQELLTDKFNGRGIKEIEGFLVNAGYKVAEVKQERSKAGDEAAIATVTFQRNENKNPAAPQYSFATLTVSYRGIPAQGPADFQPMVAITDVNLNYTYRPGR